MSESQERMMAVVEPGREPARRAALRSACQVLRALLDCGGWVLTTIAEWRTAARP